MKILSGCSLSGRYCVFEPNTEGFTCSRGIVSRIVRVVGEEQFISNAESASSNVSYDTTWVGLGQIRSCQRWNTMLVRSLQ
jgi:hypothetical protein